MATNYLLQGRRYRPSQVLAVVLITAGIVLSTLSAPPKGAPKTPSAKAADARTEALGGGFDWVYATGIAILTAALVLSALMGIWQEKTYRLHGDVWQEGLFYSVRLPCAGWPRRHAAAFSFDVVSCSSHFPVAPSALPLAPTLRASLSFAPLNPIGPLGPIGLDSALDPPPSSTLPRPLIRRAVLAAASRQCSWCGP